MAAPARLSGRAPAVAAVSLMLYGCAAHPVSVERAPEPAGRVVVQSGRPGVVVAAPHATSDPSTGDIAAAIARRTGFGLVVASGFVLEPEADGRPAWRYQVNRPGEGMPGRGPADDRVAVAARRMQDEYERRVQDAAGGRVVFYVEIHGNRREAGAGRIEIATVGVDRDHALQLRSLLELTRDAHLRGHPEAPKLAILVEPADTVSYAAGGAEGAGILRLPERALRLELPGAARRGFREVYTVILADFLVQAVMLRPLH